MFRWFEKRLDPFPDAELTVSKTDLCPFLWRSMNGAKRYLFGMTFFTALIAAFEAFLFAIIGKVVDWLANVNPQNIWVEEGANIIGIALLLLLSVVPITLTTLLKHQTLVGNFAMRMRWQFHRIMLKQSMGFYQDEFAGRISAKVMQTALAVRDVWFVVADILVYVVVYFASMVAIVGFFHPLIMVPFLVWCCLYLLGLKHFVPQLSQLARNQADARSLMTGRVTDAYTNISTVKLFSHAQREAHYAKFAMSEFLGTVHAQMRLVSSIQILNHVLIMSLIGATGGIALWLWSQGEVSVGGVAAATAMSLRLNGISHWVMWELTTLYEQIGTVQDGLGLLSTPNHLQDQPNAPDLVVNQGAIRFNQVNFQYSEAQPLFTQLSLSIKAGEKVGLVGRSGAGKSSIVNLLLRFYDVTSGTVMIDGENVKSVTQNSLRANIGMVTQDTSLLHRSVRDNILYGRPDATEAQMIAAAKRAEAHTFIQSLRDAKGRVGYDAHVGERGVKLSGGQRQRIAIARVMLKDAPILLLDEATSALDSEVEAVIQDSLYQLMEGKTVVAIAHRLSTIAAMDRLIVLDEGKVVEEGTHQSLLDKKGLYASFWAHQSGGFLGDE